MVNNITRTEDTAAIYDPNRDDPFSHFGIGPARDILLSGVNNGFTADAAAEAEEEEWRRFMEEVGSARFDSFNFMMVGGVKVSRNNLINAIEATKNDLQPQIADAQARGDIAEVNRLTQIRDRLSDASTDLQSGQVSVNSVMGRLNTELGSDGSGGVMGNIMQRARGFARNEDLSVRLSRDTLRSAGNPDTVPLTEPSRFISDGTQTWRNTRYFIRDTAQTLDRAAQDADRWWNSDPVVRGRADAAGLMNSVGTSCLSALDEWGVFNTRSPQGFGNLRVTQTSCETATEIEQERLRLRQASADGDFLGNGARELGQRFSEAAAIAGQHIAKATDYALSDESDAHVETALRVTEDVAETTTRVSGQVFKAARDGAEQAGKAVSRTFERVAKAEESGELPAPVATAVRVTRDVAEDVAEQAGRAANAVGNWTRNLFS